MQPTDKEVVLDNQVRAFVEQETLSLAMGIGFEEAMNLWSEIWRAVELCMVGLIISSDMNNTACISNSH